MHFANFRDVQLLCVSSLLIPRGASVRDSDLVESEALVGKHSHASKVVELPLPRVKSPAVALEVGRYGDVRRQRAASATISRLAVARSGRKIIVDNAPSSERLSVFGVGHDDGAKAGSGYGNGVSKPKGANGNAFKTFGCIVGFFCLVFMVVQLVRHRGSAAAAPAEPVPEAVQEQQERPENAELRELKVKRMRVMMDQAMKKEQLERIIKEIATLEAAQKQEHPMTDQELDTKVQQAMAGAEIMTQRSVFSAVAYATPFMMEQHRLYNTLQQNVMKAQERAKAVMAEESKSLLLETTKALNVNFDTSATADFMKDMKPPKLAILIASVVAPAQLKSKYLSNQSSIYSSLLFIVLNGLVLLFDGGDSPCWNKPVVPANKYDFPAYAHALLANVQTSVVLGWTFIDCAVTTFFTLIRFCVSRRLSELVVQLDAPPPVNIAEDPIAAIQTLMDYYLVSGGRALLELDRMAHSPLFEIAGWTSLFSFFWMMYGVSIVYNTPWVGCRSLALVSLRIRATLYLTFFVPLFIGLILFLVEKVFASDKVAMMLLRVADAIDEATGLGVPVGKVLVYSLMFRSMQDMVEIQIRIQKMETDKLEKQKAEIESDLSKAAQAAEAAEQEVKRLEEERAALEGDADAEETFKRVKDEALANSEAFMRKVADKAKDVQQDVMEHAASMTAAAAAEAAAQRSQMSAVTGLGGGIAGVGGGVFPDFTALEQAASAQFAAASAAATAAADDAASVAQSLAGDIDKYSSRPAGKAKVRSSRGSSTSGGQATEPPSEAAPTHIGVDDVSGVPTNQSDEQTMPLATPAARSVDANFSSVASGAPAGSEDDARQDETPQVRATDNTNSSAAGGGAADIVAETQHG